MVSLFVMVDIQHSICRPTLFFKSSRALGIMSESMYYHLVQYLQQKFRNFFLFFANDVVLNIRYSQTYLLIVFEYFCLLKIYVSK